MGLYDRRISELSESRRHRDVADRRGPFAPLPPRPVARPAPGRQRAFEPVLSEAPRRRPSMDIQSLLFSRADGWTVGKAKEWAKSHGYKHGKTHVTDQYIRIRQFAPEGLKVKRTITLGRGIRAVVAREGQEATMAARRRRRTTKEEARRPRRRRARATTEARKRRAAPAAAPKRSRRRAAREEARKPRRRRMRETAATEARRPRRRRARKTTEARRRRPVSQMMEARRPARRRRRRTAAREAWRGDRPGHSKAAKKGWRARRRAGTSRRARESTMQEARRPRRRRARRAREEYANESRRPRRSKARRTREVMEARRSRRRSYRRRGLGEARRSVARGNYVAEMAVAIVSAGVGFVLADAVDRFLATYDPSAAEKPKDKFTSDGAGTLANTLNVAARPDWKRGAAAVVMTVVPAFGSTLVDNPYGRSTLEGMAIGAGVNGFKLLWNNLLMPLLIGKDTSAPALQKSYIARLYPAEVSAHVNLSQTPPQQAVSSSGSGALSGTPAQAGVGDVGPFALAADSPYPTAEAALRKAAGVGGDSPYPTAEAALRKAAGVGGDSPYPTAEAALRQQAGVSQPPSYTPGPSSTPGPGPQVHQHGDGCGCGVGEASQDPFGGFIGEPADESDQASPLMG